MPNQKPARETYSETYHKNTVPVKLHVLEKLIKDGEVSGYVQREGILQSGQTFYQVYLIVEPEKPKDGKS